MPKTCRGRDFPLRGLKKKSSKNTAKRALLEALDPLFAPHKKSREFPARATVSAYQGYFEEAIKSSSISTNHIKGTIHLRKHVMTFECRPNGYYIYDTFSPNLSGLFKYPDNNSFIKGMHLLVQQFLQEAQVNDAHAHVSFSFSL